MANQSIYSFYTTASKKDFARQFQFRLLTFGNIAFDEEHLTYVETASLPGRTITNIPVPYMGLDFNVPGTVKYPGSAGYQVTFRCDQDYDIRSALEAATYNIFDEATSSGQYNLPGEGVTISMELYDKNFNPVRYYTLYGVYVQAIADTQYDIKDTGNIATCQATLAYQFWRSSGKGDGAFSAPVVKSSPFSAKVPSWKGS